MAPRVRKRLQHCQAGEHLREWLQRARARAATRVAASIPEFHRTPAFPALVPCALFDRKRLLRRTKVDQQTVRLVQASWKKVAAIAPQAAELFYQNLFAADPALKPLFKGDMKEQGRKLMHMIDAAVGKLNELDTLVPVLQDLARRHNGYGVKRKDYQTVGAALLKTLERGLGKDFTDEVKQAWASVYGVMADVMIAAANAERKTASAVK